MTPPQLPALIKMGLLVGSGGNPSHQVTTRSPTLAVLSATWVEASLVRVTSLEPSLSFLTGPIISFAVSLAASAARMAKLLTSSATTAGPRTWDWWTSEPFLPKLQSWLNLHFCFFKPLFQALTALHR